MVLYSEEMFDLLGVRVGSPPLAGRLGGAKIVVGSQRELPSCQSPKSPSECVIALFHLFFVCPSPILYFGSPKGPLEGVVKTKISPELTPPFFRVSPPDPPPPSAPPRRWVYSGRVGKQPAGDRSVPIGRGCYVVECGNEAKYLRHAFAQWCHTRGSVVQPRDRSTCVRISNPQDFAYPESCDGRVSNHIPSTLGRKPRVCRKSPLFFAFCPDKAPWSKNGRTPVFGVSFQIYGHLATLWEGGSVHSDFPSDVVAPQQKHLILHYNYA